MTSPAKTSSPSAGETACPTAPIGLLAELTHRCPLQCPYCSNPVQLEHAEDELTTDEWLDILDQAADLGILQLHLSGGEPTIRRDLDVLVARAAHHGLYSNLITAGVSLSEARIDRLAAAGLDHVQLSIQDVDDDNAKRICGYRGGQQKKSSVARWVTSVGLPLTINAPIHRQNIANLEAIIAFAVASSAVRLEIAHIQYYGWGLLNRGWLMTTHEQVKQSVDIVETARLRLHGQLQIDFVTPDYYAKRPKPCMGGWGRSTMNITPSGKALPCHAAETIPGLRFANVRTTGLREIWLNSEAFNRFRGTAWMSEPCANCDRREIDWGGCRCQALADTGDARATDPACALSPDHAAFRNLATDACAAEALNPVLRNPRNGAAALKRG